MAAHDLRKTHCPQGHPYDEVNTVLNAQGRRMCRTCRNHQRRVWTRKRKLELRYGISVQQYEEMREAQEGLCGICGQPCVTGRRLAVDHDHVTGRVRGLLCHACNAGIGRLKDSPDLLRRAIAYLERS